VLYVPTNTDEGSLELTSINLIKEMQISELLYNLVGDRKCLAVMALGSNSLQATMTLKGLTSSENTGVKLCRNTQGIPIAEWKQRCATWTIQIAEQVRVEFHLYKQGAYFLNFISGFINCLKGMHKYGRAGGIAINEHGEFTVPKLASLREIIALCKQGKRNCLKGGVQNIAEKDVSEGDFADQGLTDDGKLDKYNVPSKDYKTLTLMEATAEGFIQGGIWPDEECVHLQREFKHTSGYIIKAGCVAGGVIKAFRDNFFHPFYANVRCEGPTKQVRHDWQRANCYLNTLSRTIGIKYRHGTKKGTFRAVTPERSSGANSRVKGLSGPKYAARNGNSKRCYTDAGMLAKCESGAQYYFGVVKTPRSDAEFKGNKYKNPQHRNTILALYDAAGRRRMAQREFSSRRDSPVMVRLLQEIVRANQKHNELK